ncbi:MAG: hypothetical protein JSS63_10890 [Bacteroidetes bacterium]|nr:hypothetical protein [Bacteroidota bacterium]
MSIKVNHKKEVLNINLIWDWYRITIEGIFNLKKELKRNQTLLSDPKFTSLKYMTSEEFENYFYNLIFQIEILTTFNIIAATEGKIKEDFNLKLKKSISNNITDQYKELKRKIINRYRCSEENFMRYLNIDEVVDIWKTVQTGLVHDVGYVKGMFNFRNWVAHGRFWDPNFGRNYSPKDAHMYSTNLITKFSHIDNW